jgi:hypothetical protein
MKNLRLASDKLVLQVSILRQKANFQKAFAEKRSLHEQ